MRPARIELATSASVLRAQSTEVLDLTPLGVIDHDVDVRVAKHTTPTRLRSSERQERRLGQCSGMTPERLRPRSGSR